MKISDVNDRYLADLVVLCLGELGRMKERGLVEGGCFQLGPEGEKRYQELVDRKFSPSTAEINMAMDVLMSDTARETAAEMLADEQPKKEGGE